jgi:hypothetical protein
MARSLHRHSIGITWVMLAWSATLATGCSKPQSTPERRWLAGDSHIHSHWSPDDGHYPIPVNAQMARRYGLSWMVTTDHGGPDHAKVNMTQAYEELKESRQRVPQVLQFYGMELNMPGMDHHTLIIPHAEDERSVLFDIESRFDAGEISPPDPARDTESARLGALDHMNALSRLPILFANHPSRSATGIGEYGRVEPQELRTSNDRAPDVYRGMEGAPGHQAATLAPDGTPKRDESGRPSGFRGFYRNPGAHTLGGFDQMTAIVGGVWDSLLSEGRRFWIVATSDSHRHYTDSESVRPGVDFWPGEYQKTYVHAEHTYEDVLDGLRSGRIFAVAGDLVTELDVIGEAAGQTAGAGGTLSVAPDDRVAITIRFLDPDTTNEHGDSPKVSRVDLILGEIRDLSSDRHETTRVVARFTEREWTQEGDRYRMSTTLPTIDNDLYVRVRGTSTQEAEPLMDEAGEDPWADLWFYSNPIFIEVE